MNWKFVLLLVGVWLCVAATNRFTDPDRDRATVVESAGDSFSYFAIAQSAPGLPVAQHIPFHHAQRLVIPYLIGLFSRLIPISISTLFLLCVAALELVTLLVVATIALELQLSRAQAALIAALLAFNPWAFRYYLTFPGILIDVAFVCGLSLLLLGLFRQRFALTLGGLLLAAVARQTALVLIPGIVLWILLDWENVASRRKMLVAASVLVLPVFVYVVTGRAATSFAAPSQNMETLTGIFGWVRSSFDSRTLAVFLLRAITPFTMAVAVWLGCVRRGPVLPTRDAVRSWLLAGIAFCVCLQPLLGGPVVTGDTIIRLTSLGMVPAVLIVALQLRRSGLFVRGGGVSLLALGALVAIGSMHHETTYAGWAPEQRSRFALIFASASLGAFLIAWSDLRADVR